MKDFLTTYGSLVTGDWPTTVGKNASGPTATDGTPFTADFINDLWGWQKRVMYLAGITPNGASDTYTASQVLTALQCVIRGPGEVCLSALNATARAARRLLQLKGQTVLIETYPDLCESVYCGDANNASAEAFFKCTDSSGSTRSTTGTYLKLPDARGLFPRGVGTNASLAQANGDYFTGGTLVGSRLTDMMQSFGIPTGAAGSGSSYAAYGTAQSYTISPVTNGYGSLRIGKETRPACIAFELCISY